MKRSAGVLMPISSLPSKYGIGTLGKGARDFIDFLEKSGQTYWQVLPIGPTGYGDSPYQSFSTFAGNPYFIDLCELIEEGLLSEDECDSYDWGDDVEYIDYEKIYLSRFKILKKAYKRSKINEDKKFIAYCKYNKWWLEDYALYMAIKDYLGGISWLEWDENLKLRDKKTLSKYSKKLNEEITFYKYTQYLFSSQWNKLKVYANKKGISIIGDIPIYVALDSADTWANPELFQLDKDLNPIAVAGCPPDSFSEDGQLWGNPLYDWEYHKYTNYKWWIKRIKYCYNLYDIVRIDHFRGFDEYFSIPYFFYLARSQYWIANCKLPMYVLKKKNQIYLQTWHGTPLKRLGHDIIASDNATFYRSAMSFESMCQSYDIDVARYNYMISPNKFCTEVFQTSFGINRERLIETGYPRNDFITNATADDVKSLKDKFHLPMDKKIILYAPTWRDNSFVAAGYTFDLKADFHKWKDILGDEYVIVFKPHYLIINKYENDHSLDGFLYSISANAEINELYVLSDILITDYSSVFFDYAVLNRPIYFYMYDIDEYKGELRGFYLDIYKELPGKIYEYEKQMLLDIKNNVYDYSYLKIFNERFNSEQTGNCAQKVIDIVFKDI